jgi:hypothetical protein
MPDELEDYSHIEEELVALLNDLLAELPLNAASLEIRRVLPKGDGVVARLQKGALLYCVA